MVSFVHDISAKLLAMLPYIVHGQTDSIGGTWTRLVGQVIFLPVVLILNMQQATRTGWRIVRAISCRRRRTGFLKNYHCRARDFARHHPSRAIQVLTPPKFDESVARGPFETLEEYLRRRDWYLSSGEDFDSSVDLVSHPLTYPLTMNLFADRFLRGTKGSSYFARSHGKKDNLHICCVGARAEATLPLKFWNEFLVARYMSGNQSNLNMEILNWEIDFVGPETPKKESAVTRIETQSNSIYNLRMNFYNCFFEKYVHKPDVYVLFNPGFGHPHLKEGWRSTLKTLVKHRERPVYITAHSTSDMERDAFTIASEQEESNFSVHCFNVNPFSSKMGSEDPFHQNEIVFANKYFGIL